MTMPATLLIVSLGELGTNVLEAAGRSGLFERIVVATRRFHGAPGPEYAVPEEPISDKVTLVRLASASPGYRVKEEMHAEVQSFAENLIAWIAGQHAAQAAKA